MICKQPRSLEIPRVCDLVSIMSNTTLWAPKKFCSVASSQLRTQSHTSVYDLQSGLKTSALSQTTTENAPFPTQSYEGWSDWVQLRLLFKMQPMGLIFSKKMKYWSSYNETLLENKPLRGHCCSPCWQGLRIHYMDQKFCTRPEFYSCFQTPGVTVFPIKGSFCCREEPIMTI